MAPKIGKLLVRLIGGSRDASVRPDDETPSSSVSPTPVTKKSRSQRAKPSAATSAAGDLESRGTRGAALVQSGTSKSGAAKSDAAKSAPASRSSRGQTKSAPNPAVRTEQPGETEAETAAVASLAAPSQPEPDPTEKVDRALPRPKMGTAARHYAAIIEQTLAEFGAPVQVVHAETGPMLLRFGVAPGYLQRPARGDQPARRERVRAAKIVSRTNDLALALGVISLRIEAPVPGKTYIGVEIPNPNPKPVQLPPLLEEPRFKEQLDRGVLPIVLGRDVSGLPILADLARLPHLLIAGATGSGKSVAVNTLIGTILRTRSPAEARLIVVDPKRVEFTWLEGVPHMLTPVVTEIEQAVEVLGKAETEMAHRYDLLAEAGCRNRLAYNAHHQPGLPALIVVIDELADLMMLASDDVERSICRLAQLGRAAGIHLVVATQRPSVDVVTGLIKANLPARLAFAVSSMVDSRTVLDTPGAERLLGRGDFLFLAPDAMRPIRGQGAFARDSWLNQSAKATRAGVPAGASDPEAERFARLLSATQIAEDKLYGSARQLAQEHPRISASYLQRKLHIGYPKAEALVERLRADGILPDPDLDDE